MFRSVYLFAVCKSLFLFISCLLVGYGGFAQSGDRSLKGLIYDSVQRRPCAFVNVCLLKLDSSLLIAARSDVNGEWEIDGVQPNRYIVQIRDAGYMDYSIVVTIGSRIKTELPLIVLTPKNEFLTAITVISKKPHIQIKHDTIEYNLSAMPLQLNESVEGMLARLPGLRIASDGSITYNGQKIEKLLVDGEDLFGSDPSLITRNFDANRIASVQLLDRKTDHAILTGIDDGVRIKTLNLLLKHDTKDGYFGKLEGEGGLGGIFNSAGLAAWFRERVQYAAIGLASNTGSTGYNSGGTGVVASMNNDILGATAGVGVPKIAGTALHYANTFKNLGDQLDANYQYSHLLTLPITRTNTEQTLPGSIYNQYDLGRSNNEQAQQSGDARYGFNIDSFFYLKGEVHGIMRNGANQLVDTSVSNFNGKEVNSELRAISDNDYQSDIDVLLEANLRIARRRQQNLYLGLEWGNTRSTTDGFINSLSRFYDAAGISQPVDTINQRMHFNSLMSNFVANIDYTKAMWKNGSFGLNYIVTHTAFGSVQNAYSGGDGKYTVLIDSLTYEFQGYTQTQSVAANLQGHFGYWHYSIGEQLQLYSSRMRETLADLIRRQEFRSLLPHAILEFTANRSFHWEINYSTAVQLPSISQILPSENNSDPLHIMIGNSALRPGYDQKIRLHFDWSKKYLIGGTIILGKTNNSIGTKVTTDSLGRQITQVVNVNGDKSAALLLSVSRTFLGLNFGLHSDLRYGEQRNYLDTILNTNNTYTANNGVSIARFVQDQYNISLNTSLSHFYTQNSVNRQQRLHYWTQTHELGISILAISNWEIHTDVFYTVQQAGAALAGSLSTFVWNAALTKNFVAGKIAVRFRAINLLNQNMGITRTSSANVSSEAKTNVLGRNWLIGAIWRFDQHKVGKRFE